MGSSLLWVAALLSFLVAALHVGMIAAGAPAYRYFGAGESMARLAEQGSPIPALVTAGVTVLFVLSGLYPLAAAGWLPRLPFLKTGLVCIAAVYTLRGLLLIAQLATGGSSGRLIRELVFSAVSLAIGLVYIAAIASVWARLRP